MDIPGHLLRFGKSSEKKILEMHSDTFESVVINAPSLAYFGKSLSTFVFIKSKGKSFFIDPLTHAFQHPLDKISNNNGNIKPSIEKLISHYGFPLSNIILNLKRPLKPGDMTENETKKNFARRVLEFQRKHLFNSLEDDFKEYIEDDEFGDMLPSTPIFLVPPYFYMTESNFRQWVPLNREFVEISKNIVGDEENIFGELVVSKGLLKALVEDEEIFKEISGIYRRANGILFWIDEFDEHQANSEFLKIVSRFVKKIKKKYPGKPLINLYGGYYSQLLLKFGLDGVVHGPEYGESRSVVPVGGGIPIARFYFPGIHKRIPSGEVISLLTSQDIKKPGTFFKKICSCKVCRTLIKKDVQKDFIENYGKTKPVSFGRGIREFPVQETTDNCLAHYLEVKKIEFDYIEKKELPELLNELEETYRQFENEIWIDEKEIKHLEHWVDALRNE